MYVFVGRNSSVEFKTGVRCSRECLRASLAIGFGLCSPMILVGSATRMASVSVFE